MGVSSINGGNDMQLYSVNKAYLPESPLMFFWNHFSRLHVLKILKVTSLAHLPESDLFLNDKNLQDKRQACTTIYWNFYTQEPFSYSARIWENNVWLIWLKFHIFYKFDHFTLVKDFFYDKRAQ